MSLNIQNTRVTFKYSTISGETPTIAPSLDHSDGAWTPTDLYVGEFFLNAVDDTMWVRTLNGIIPLTSGTTTIDISAYVNKTGDTMTGPLNGTIFSGETFYGDNINGTIFSGGTFYGDGSNLTGITSNFNGGTVTGDTTFTGQVDLCGAGVTLDTIEVCSGSTLQIIGDAEVNGTLTTTNDLTVGGIIYGDGSGITNLPSLSGVTLDQVLLQGDTSTNGNITLVNGVFTGDGSGLTNLSATGLTKTLDEVLTDGNSTGNNWIDVSENGTGYGLYSGTYGSDLNLINFKNDRLLLYSWNGVDGKSQVTLWRDGNVDIQGGDTLSLDGTNSVLLQSTAGDIQFDVFSAITVNSPSPTFRGIEYTTDYSGTFTDRSLVDKEYVDNAISGATPSLSEVLLVGNSTDGSNIVLGYDKITSAFGDPYSIFHSEGQWNIEANETDREGRFILRPGFADTELYNRQYVGSDYTQGKLLIDNNKTQLGTSVVNGGIDEANGILGIIGGDYPTIDLGVNDVDGNSANIHLEGNYIEVIGTDAIGPGFRGMEYNNDYSANYTNRSLVDKEYVDNASLPLSGSLTVTVSPTASTSNFNGYRIIGKSSTDNKELDFQHYIPKRSTLYVPLGILPGTFVLATVPLSDPNRDFFEFRYSARKSTTPFGREVGTITAFYDGYTDTIEFSRTGPISVGDVSGLDLNVIKTGTTLQLTADLTGSSDWDFIVHTTAYQSGFLE